MALHFRCSASEVVHHRAVRTTMVVVEEDDDEELELELELELDVPKLIHHYKHINK